MSEDNALKLSEIDVRHNHVFDLGASNNPIDSARRILNSEIGQAFHNSLTNSLEITHHSKENFEKYFHDKELLKNSGVISSEFDDETLEESFVDYVFNTHTLPSLQAHVDYELLSEPYLTKNLLSRVYVQSFWIKYNSEEIRFDVSVTIHKTGICILTFSATFDFVFSTDEFIDFQKLSKFALEYAIIPTPIGARQYALQSKRMPLSEAEQREFEAGFPPTYEGYVKIQPSEGIYPTLRDLFEFYRHYLVEIVNRKTLISLEDLKAVQRSLDWFNYPIFFVKNVFPFTEDDIEFEEKYSQDVVKIVLGINTSSSIRQSMLEEVIGSNQSIVDSYSFYVNEGKAILFYYPKHREKIIGENEVVSWMRQELDSSVLIDLMLIQKGILSLLSKRALSLTYNLSDLYTLKQEYLSALGEIEVLEIAQYGSVHEIIKASQIAMRIHDHREFFLTNLNTLEQLISNQERILRQNRDRVIKYLTTIVTLVLALPASRNVISVISDWQSTPSKNYSKWITSVYSGIVTTVSDHPVMLTILLYVFIVAVTLLATWFGVRNNQSINKRQVLNESPKPIEPEMPTSPINIKITPVKGTTTENNDQNGE